LIGREQFRAVPVQLRMKKKLCLITLVGVAAGVTAAAGGYVRSLASKTRSLEARLARVEAELNGKKTTEAWTAPPAAALAKQGTVQVFRSPGSWLPGGEQDTLERRVEKLEKQLTPHVELLLAKPDAPAFGSQ
jgi:ABC-type glycerol-3-phosphate transport system substrate-binding protein